VRAGREGKAAVATWERREVGEGRGFIYIGFERVVANFLFKFLNLYNYFEIYQNYTTTVMGYSGSRLTTVVYGG
jgi:hypothetical protein